VLVNVDETVFCSGTTMGAGGLDVEFVVTVVVVLPQAFDPSDEVFDPGEVECDTPS
jgi:hypothetical protein